MFYNHKCFINKLNKSKYPDKNVKTNWQKMNVIRYFYVSLWARFTMTMKKTMGISISVYTDAIPKAVNVEKFPSTTSY